MVSDFKEKNTFENRLKESTAILERYPTRIPVIVLTKGDLTLDKIKYLVPNDLTIGQFIYVLRKRIKLSPEQSIHCFIDNNIPRISERFDQIYKKHADKDNFLYLTVSKEVVFG